MKGTPVTNEEQIEMLKNEISMLTEAIKLMSKQQNIITAELEGFKHAFIQLAAFLPITKHDVTIAQSQAIAMAEDATEFDDMPAEHWKIVFSTIRSVMAVSGEIWQERQGH